MRASAPVFSLDITLGNPFLSRHSTAGTRSSLEAAPLTTVVQMRTVVSNHGNPEDIMLLKYGNRSHFVTTTIELAWFTLLRAWASGKRDTNYAGSRSMPSVIAKLNRRTLRPPCASDYKGCSESKPPRWLHGWLSTFNTRHHSVSCSHGAACRPRGPPFPRCNLRGGIRRKTLPRPWRHRISSPAGYRSPLF